MHLARVLALLGAGLLLSSAGCVRPLAPGDAAGEPDARDGNGPDARVDIDASDTASDAASDAAVNLFEVFPFPHDGAIGACVSCLDEQCGMQINACVNDPVCRDGIGCTLVNCLGPHDGGPPDGGLDFACINQCFMGNFNAIAQAVSAVGCVSSQCVGNCINDFFPDAGAQDVGGP
jgi:hypothetical protein